jgi:hypothetical protein
MRASSCSFLLATTFALLVGCSSSDDGGAATDAAGDAGDANVDVKDTREVPFKDADDDSSDASADAGCNTVINVALAVTEQNVAANLPLGTGGLIADGIYVVTAVTRYNGPGGKTGPGTRTIEETISIIDGKTVQGVRKIGSDAGYAYTAGIAPSGGSLAWKQTCPSGEVGVSYDYSIGDTTIDIYDKVQKIGTTYTRKNLKP